MLTDRRRRLWRRRVRFGTERVRAAADKHEAGNQGDKQTSGYSEHLSHPNVFRHSKRRMGEG
jgi:hypothetical protein